MIFNPVYGGASAPNLGTKNITANDTYLASADGLDGFSEVTVAVPNTYSASDEGKVVDGGALVGQTSATKTANGTYDTTLNDEVIVNVQPTLYEPDVLDVEQASLTRLYSTSIPYGSYGNKVAATLALTDETTIASHMASGWNGAYACYYDSEYQIGAYAGYSSSTPIPIDAVRLYLGRYSGQNITLTATVEYLDGDGNWNEVADLSITTSLSYPTNYFDVTLPNDAEIYGVRWIHKKTPNKSPNNNITFFGMLLLHYGRKFTSNGDYPIPTGYDGYGDIEVDVQPVLQAKTGLSITANGSFSYTPDAGYDGLSEVSGTVAVSGGGGATVLSGADSPENSIGSNGDLYLQHFPNTAPTGYTALDYVELVNGGYVNTGIVPSNHFVDAWLYDVSYTNDKHWFGTTAGASYMHFTTYSNRYYWGRNGNEANGGSWTSGLHHVEYNKGSNYQIIIDGTVIGSGTNSVSAQPLDIGRRNTAANAANLRVLSIKMYNKSDDSLVLDLIPVQRNSDSAIGFYDTVSGNFFGNAGSGTFISGGNPTGQIINAYAKVNGTWQGLIGTNIDDINFGS